MTYLAYIIAAFKLFFSNTRGMDINQVVHTFLTYAAGINELFFKVGFVVWALIIIGILIFAFAAGREFITESGCVGIFIGIIFGLFPLWQFILWRINLGLANAWTDQGLVDPSKFILFVIITLIIGAG